MTKSCDLKFIRIFHILIHLGIIATFVYLLWNFFVEYEEHDEEVRQLVYDSRDKCTNLTVIIDYILNQKNETGKMVVLHMIYLMSISVSLILMALNHVPVLSAYTLFFITILCANLVIHFLAPFVSVALFLTSTTLSVVYIIVYLLPDFYHQSNLRSASAPSHDDYDNHDLNHRESIVISSPMLTDSQFSLAESRL